MIQKTVLTITAVAAFGVATAAWAEGFWSKVGKGIDDAADATVETSKDAWDATKKGSSAAWDKTKEVSGDAWDGTKEAVHDGAEYVEEKTD